MALAPDASSAKAARSCTSPGKWVTKGQNDAAIWGEFQGSGKKPYQTQIDRAGPSFKCSCPSRKFPCKHGLGLLLVLAEKPELVAEAEPPAWVSEWLEARAGRAEKKAEKAAEKKPVDPAQQAKRLAAREKKIAAGLDELDVFLQDLVRSGLADVRSKPRDYFTTPAARLIDAQAAGLARRVGKLPEIASSGDDWQAKLLAEIGRIHLLAQAYRRQDQLPEDACADVRSHIGWTVGKDELAALSPVPGTWVVAAEELEEEGHLKTLRTWLIEKNLSQVAMILSFGAAGSMPERPFAPGSECEASLVFYPSAAPLRAAVHEVGECDFARELPGKRMEAALADHAAAVAVAPWLEDFPMALTNVVPMRRAGGWWLLDEAAGRALPMRTRHGRAWQMLAVSGGQSCSLFGLWDGDKFDPLACAADGQMLPLQTGPFAA